MLLSELLPQRRIRIDEYALGWESAIEAGGSILMEDGLVEHRYIEAIKKTVRELGPYIVIAPGIAISHSKPEAGTKGIGMSLIRLRNPVNFGHEANDPVKLVFTLSATDSTSHLNGLKQLMSILLEKEDLDKLFYSQSIDELTEVIAKHSK